VEPAHSRPWPIPTTPRPPPPGCRPRRRTATPSRAAAPRSWPASPTTRPAGTRRRATPGRASTLSNLGATWLRLGRPRDALDALDAALAAAPGDRDAAFHRADALLALGETEPALQAIERARDADPSHAGTALRRGEILVRLGRVRDALAAFEAAASLAGAAGPGRALASRHLGNLLREAGRLPEARAAFEAALAAGGDADELRFLLASVHPPATGDATAPPEAPPAFVRDLFDGYAGDYDRHLLEDLGYRAHAALVEPLPGAVGRSTFGRALDLGCGTGLCGPLLRPFVAHLAGVDLAPRMVALARRSGAYDDVAVGEAVAALAATPPGTLDLAVAADVLIYLGDPEPLVRAAATALAPGGVLAFTVERADAGEGGAEVVLDPTLRFRHADALWPRLAARHGFALRAARPEVLRHEQGRPVDGLAVVLVRGG
jgi:predicted TPR repeat methyltransferase